VVREGLRSVSHRNAKRENTGLNKSGVFWNSPPFAYGVLRDPLMN